MAWEELFRTLATTLAARSDRRRALGELCVACVSELEVSGAGVALLIGGQHRGTLAVSDDWVVGVEDLQFTLGEGPCLDAYATGRPASEANLAETVRWPAYSPEALAVGVTAVFAVPLQVGTARFGALDLYRRTPGPIAEGAMAELLAVADLVTTVVMGSQARGPTPGAGQLVEELSDRRAVVHQAAGMISVQLGVGLEEALMALRARAFVDGRGIGAIAEDVVAGRLRFDS